MPAWPSNGSENWNDAMSACFASEHSTTTGMHKPKVCHLTLSTAQLNFASGSWIKVLLDTAVYDPNSWAVLGSNHIVPQEAGYYLVMAKIRIAKGAYEKNYSCMITKNNSTTAGIGFSTTIPGTTAGDVGVTTYAITSLNGTTDGVQLYVAHNDGSSTPDVYAGESYTSLSVIKLGEV